MSAINLGNGLWIYKTDSEIDALDEAATTLFTTRDEGQRFYPLSMMVEVASETSLSAGAEYSAGGNGGVDDVVDSGTTGDTLNSVKTHTGTLTSIAPGTDVGFKVSAKATATAAGLKVIVMGFYAD